LKRRSRKLPSLKCRLKRKRKLPLKNSPNLKKFLNKKRLMRSTLMNQLKRTSNNNNLLLKKATALLLSITIKRKK
jgi:hypothetical protein